MPASVLSKGGTTRVPSSCGTGGRTQARTGEPVRPAHIKGGRGEAHPNRCLGDAGRALSTQAGRLLLPQLPPPLRLPTAAPPHRCASPPQLPPPLRLRCSPAGRPCSCLAPRQCCLRRPQKRPAGVGRQSRTRRQTGVGNWGAATGSSSGATGGRRRRRRRRTLEAARTVCVCVNGRAASGMHAWEHLPADHPPTRPPTWSNNSACASIRFSALGR